MFKSITSKPLWVNILVAIGIVALLVLLFFSSLSWLTGHGKAEKVPNVIGQNVTAAIKNLEAKGFDVVVQDSVFIDSIASLAIVKQIPEADANVKKGRTVYLTVNRAIAPLIEMPSLIGFSLKSAQLYLQTLHLKLGDTTFKPYFAKNSIIEQLYNGKSVAAGTKIPMGSTISFVIGSGLGNTEIDVPDLYGMTVQQALDFIQSYSISKGVIVGNGAETIKDTLNAYIYDQSPQLYSEPLPNQKIRNRIREGQTMDFRIQIKVPPARVDNTTADSTQKP